MSERNLDFDAVIDRRGTKCLKYDFAVQRGRPAGVLPLWVADMDFKVSSYIEDALVRQAQHAIYGYTESGTAYFEAVQQWLAAHHGWQVQPDWLQKTPGVVFAIAVAVKACTQPGDAVLIQQPVYYPFSEVIVDNGRRLISSDLVLDEAAGHYGIDFADFERKIVENHVKLFLLCSPHNPVGRVWTEDELKRIAVICAKNDVIVFSDEIHADLVFEGSHHPMGAAAEGTGLKCVCAYAAGKTFNLASLNTAAVVIPNPEVRELFRKQLGRNGLNVPPGAFGAVGSEAAYLYGEPYLEELLVYLRGNIDYAFDFIQEKLPGVKMRKPEGTYLAWIDFRGLGLSCEETDRFVLEKAKVVFDPGWWFGKEGSCFMRMNLACPRSMLEEGLERLQRALDALIQEG